MAVADSDLNFGNWLNGKLRELNTDESIFGDYITGILEGDESTDEKTEALESILSEMIEDNLQAIIEEILDKWDRCRPKVEVQKKQILEDVDAQLAKILETQKLQTIVQKKYTPEELRIREQILAQYSQTEVSGDEEDEDGPGGDGDSNSDLAKNTNFSDVQQLQKERREQAKLDSQNKKQKDKEDREKQKQLREEKKEKRKTVKGERRR